MISANDNNIGYVAIPMMDSTSSAYPLLPVAVDKNQSMNSVPRNSCIKTLLKASVVFSVGFLAATLYWNKLSLLQMDLEKQPCNSFVRKFVPPPPRVNSDNAPKQLRWKHFLRNSILGSESESQDILDTWYARNEVDGMMRSRSHTTSHSEDSTLSGANDYSDESDASEDLMTVYISVLSKERSRT